MGRKAVPLEIRFRSRVERRGVDDCWPWTGARDRDGYGVISDDAPSTKQLRAHRVAWALVNGPVPDGVGVLHRCDSPPCCNAAHLFLGSTQENTADRVQKGRSSRASRNARLTVADVRAIRDCSAMGDRQGDIARRFGVTQTAISQILTGKTWCWLE